MRRRYVLGGGAGKPRAFYEQRIVSHKKEDFQGETCEGLLMAMASCRV